VSTYTDEEVNGMAFMPPINPWEEIFKAINDLRERVEALERRNTKLELINGAYAVELTPEQRMEYMAAVKRAKERMKKGKVAALDPIEVKDPQ